MRLDAFILQSKVGISHQYGVSVEKLSTKEVKSTDKVVLYCHSVDSHTDCAVIEPGLLKCILKSKHLSYVVALYFIKYSPHKKAVENKNCGS